MTGAIALPLPPLEERRRALDGRVPEWRPSTLDRTLAALASEFDERPYVLSEEGSLSYSDVVRHAETFAKGLRRLGVHAGDRVALVMANHPVFVPLAFAVWRLGAVLIPVNFVFRTKELAYVFGQSGARVVITMRRFRDLDYVAMLDEMAPGWEKGPVAAFPNLASVIIHGECERDAVTVDALERIGAEDKGGLPTSPVGPFDAAVIMYTSGTTGLPKGVVQSHDNLLRSAYCQAYHQGYRDGRRTLFALPLYHAFGLVVGVLASMFCGGAVVPQLVFDPVRTFADIERFRATDALFVPTMAMALIEHPERERYDLSSLTGVLSGAAPTPARSWQELIQKLGLSEVFTGYGMTELSCATVMTESGDPLELVERTVGTPMQAGAAGVPELGGRIGEYRTVDPFSAELRPEGAEGDLVFRGPTATSGYFELPEETARLLLPGGWVRSGDLGRVLPNGYIQLTGRSKELYKTGGELVAPKEVEEVLGAHADVAQSFVVGVPDDHWGEIGVAWVVPSPGRQPSAEALQTWCKERLAKFKWPRHVFFITADDLPKTPTGKVQKFQLVKMASARLARA
jgi:fatty-acyl-CoA synthase